MAHWNNCPASKVSTFFFLNFIDLITCHCLYQCHPFLPVKTLFFADFQELEFFCCQITQIVIVSGLSQELVLLAVKNYCSHTQMVQFWRELDIALVQNKKKFDMKSELQISCVFVFFTLWKRVERSNYGEFLKVKNVLFMYTMYYHQQRTSTLRIWKVCLHSNMYA
jgi:hypothetical protein